MDAHTPRLAARLARWCAVAALFCMGACTYDFDAFSAKPDATWTAGDAPQDSGGASGPDAARSTGGAWGTTGGALGTDAALGTGGATGTDAALGTGGATVPETRQPGTGGVPSQSGGSTTTTATGGQPGPDADVPGSGGAPGTGGTAGNTLTCSGRSQSGICWYLGSSGSSCQQTCASHGQSAPEAAGQIGTSKQGGSLTNCASLLGLLGIAMAPGSATRSDGRGLGCHVSQSAAYWLSTPDFSPTAFLSGYRVVCGCTR